MMKHVVMCGIGRSQLNVGSHLTLTYRGTTLVPAKTFSHHYHWLSTSPRHGTTERDTKESVQARPFGEIPGPPTGWRQQIKDIYKLFKTGFSNSKFVFLKDFLDTYGPIAVSSKQINTVFLFDAHDFAQVHREEGKYPKRMEALLMRAHREFKEIPYGVFSSDGPEWRRYRSALSKYILRPKEVVKYTDRLSDTAEDLVSRIQILRKGNGTVKDLEKLLQYWAFEGGASVIFGKRFNLLSDNPDHDAALFNKALKSLTLPSVVMYDAKSIKVNKDGNTFFWKKFVKNWDQLFDITGKCLYEKNFELKSRQAQLSNCPESGLDYLTNLITEGKLSEKELHTNLTEVFLAATDTAKSALTWVLYVLGRNPRVQEKLYREVMLYAPFGQPITERTMSEHRWNYIKAVLKESLRLYPPAIGNLRILDHDIVLRGYNIPAGTILVGMTYYMSRDPKNFYNELDFIPERWNRKGFERFDGFKSMPFGFGARMCLGRRVAELEIYVALIKILREFKLECAQELHPGFKFGQQIMMPNKPLKLQFVQR
ncbi:1,25-dihydroxyvitamin D(3) 24-hydroxylase, mitochondrial-like [Saccoglossus kowalevskii]